MSNFTQFLAEQAEKLRTGQQEVLRTRDEWVAAVDGLTGQIRDWLGSSDPDHVLDVAPEEYELREQRLGTYKIDGLVISLGPRLVRVKPIARYVLGPISDTGAFRVLRSHGRVDLTDGLRKFMIYRLEREPQDRWCIVEEDSHRLEPLDQRAFEAALQSLLE
jgi:hypothetical protein